MKCRNRNFEIEGRMNDEDNEFKILLKKLDPPVRKELLRLRKNASKSITNLRSYEAYRDTSVEPYILRPHGYMNYALTRVQEKILINKIKALPLSPFTKNNILERTRSFFIEFRYEFYDRIYFRKECIRNKAIKDLRQNFELEIDSVISRYRKNFSSTDLAFELTEFQTKIIALFHEHFDDDPLKQELEKLVLKFNPDAKNRDQELIERYAPSNRPSYECYPPYLYDLSNFIQEEQSNYIPIIVELLTSFQKTALDIFDSFVINKASIRSLISKHRRSINKGVKY